MKDNHICLANINVVAQMRNARIILVETRVWNGSLETLGIIGRMMGLKAEGNNGVDWTDLA
jgi:hypothetical protein